MHDSAPDVTSVSRETVERVRHVTTSSGDVVHEVQMTKTETITMRSIKNQLKAKMDAIYNLFMHHKTAITPAVYDMFKALLMSTATEVRKANQSVKGWYDDRLDPKCEVCKKDKSAPLMVLEGGYSPDVVSPRGNAIGIYLCLQEQKAQPDKIALLGGHAIWSARVPSIEGARAIQAEVCMQWFDRFTC